MSTDNLIAAIAADGAARPPSIAWRMAVALGIGGAISGVLFAYSLGVRPDIASALQTWRFATKLAIVLTSFAVTLWAAARLARPDANELRTLAVLALPLAMLALAIAGELAVSPPRHLARLGHRQQLPALPDLSRSPVGRPSGGPAGGLARRGAPIAGHGGRRGGPASRQPRRHALRHSLRRQLAAVRSALVPAPDRVGHARRGRRRPQDAALVSRLARRDARAKGLG